jgi:hypothetical protein
MAAQSSVPSGAAHAMPASALTWHERRCLVKISLRLVKQPTLQVAGAAAVQTLGLVCSSIQRLGTAAKIGQLVRLSPGG